MVNSISFPSFSNVRCLMMPYIQGDPDSVPLEYGYRDILASVFLHRGDIGFLTIDESFVQIGKPHRGARAKYQRALHTEVGRDPDKIYVWGGGNWGESHSVTLDRGTQILLANNLDDSCAIWNSDHRDISVDGDLGNFAQDYSYNDAIFMKAGEVHKIGILTPHESLPVKTNFFRQFLRIVGSGVHGRESYFTQNPLIPFA